jgi:hypothetical protein
MIAAIASLRAVSLSAQIQEKAKGHYPVAEYENLAPLDSKSRALKDARGARYSRGRNQPIKELPLDVEELPVITHGRSGEPALPVAESDVVVIGEIADAKAFLSNDRTAVYSEFAVRVDESLKSLNNSPTSGETIVAERAGGAVRFPSGRIQYYSIHQRGLPRVGTRHVFFLKHNELGDDFSIVTAYELRDGRVFPLDGADTDKGGKLPYDEYRDYEAGSFLKLIRAAIAEPRQIQGERGGQ